MIIVAARIVITPSATLRYKVVLHHHDGQQEEMPVATIREGEAIIRSHIPPEPRSQAQEWQPPLAPPKVQKMQP